MNRTWPLLALLLAGCGYVVGSPFRPDVRSVAVPIFQNDTYRKGVEFQLTEAVQKEMQQRGLQIAEEPYADTRLTGKIVEIQKQVAPEIIKTWNAPVLVKPKRFYQREKKEDLVPVLVRPKKSYKVEEVKKEIKKEISAWDKMFSKVKH